MVDTMKAAFLGVTAHWIEIEAEKWKVWAKGGSLIYDHHQAWTSHSWNRGKEWQKPQVQMPPK